MTGQSLFRGFKAGVVVGFACALVTGHPVPAQVSTRVGGANISLNSFVQADWALATSERPNQFNEHALTTKHNALNQAAERWESLFSIELDPARAASVGLDSFRLFAHPRLFADFAPEIDENLPEVNLAGGRDGGRYPGNGWLTSTQGTHEYMLDVQEAYLDLRKGPLRMRLGKQQIAWGTALFLRSLDAVNSLDLRRHAIFDVIGNEYADERIAEWTALATYDFPSPIPGLSDTSITGFVSPDFEPFILPANGSAYNVLPSVVLLNDGQDIATARHKLVYGGVLKGSIWGIDLTANYVSTPNTLGIFKLAPAFGPNGIPGTPFVFDSANGVNSTADFVYVLNKARLSLPAVANTLLTKFSSPIIPALLSNPALLEATLTSTPVSVAATRVFPRDEIFGGSAQYYFQPIHEFPGAALINGTLLKFEGTYTPSRAFTSPGLGDPIRSGELNFAVETEKQVRWNMNIPSAFVVAEYWYKSRSDFFNRYEPSQGEKDFQLIGLAVQQGFYGNRLRVDNTVVLDITSGLGSWIQPGVAYKPRDYLQLDVYYNFFQGANKDIFGPLQGLDEIFTKVTYKF